MISNDRAFAFIMGAGLVMGLATIVADCERHKIDSADAYTQGYVHAADSVASAVEWRRYDAGYSRGYVAGLNRRDTLEVGR